MMPNSILGITFFALLAASSNMQAEELKRLQIVTPPPVQLMAPQSKAPAPVVGLTTSPVGLKDAKQANDGGLTRTPFNHRITSDSIELHVETSPSAANRNASSNYEALGRPIRNTGPARTQQEQRTCTPPQIADGDKCVDPPSNYEALGKPVRNSIERTKEEITCTPPQVSDGMGKCITPLAGQPLDCPAPAVVINNQCVMQPK